MLALVAALCVGHPAAASAQVVSGKLLESGSDRPLVLGRVALLDSALVPVEITYTDHEGRFTIRAPAPGDYWIAADHLGYRPVVDGIIELGEGGFLPIHLYIRPAPIRLAGVTATAERRRTERKLTVSGFFEREQQGFGNFITPDEIRERPPADVPDLVRRLPGPVFQDQGVHGQLPLFRARGPVVSRQEFAGVADDAPGGYCYPRIYVDGALVSSHEMPPPRPSIEEIVAVEDVIAVESYRGGASMPFQWGGSQGNCGALVFWTGR